MNMYYAIIDIELNTVLQFLGGIPEWEVSTYPLPANQKLVLSAEFGKDPKDYVYSEAAGIIYSPRGESPGESFRFDSEKRIWIDSRTLDDIKRERWELIKAHREQAINAKLHTPYGVVDSGERDRVNITNSVMMLQTLAGLGTPGTVQFTMADNSTVELDTSKMVHIGLLLGQKIEAAHATARTLRQAIDEAQTIEEVLAITWS